MIIHIDDEYDLHKGFDLTLEPGYTALVGPNGAGKTTLLFQLKEYAKEHKIRVWEYSNLVDGGGFARQAYLNHGLTEQLAASIMASEGEQVAMNFSERVGDLGATVRASVASDETLFVLLDAIDSGASIDRARDIMDLFGIMYEHDISKGAKVYVVMAVNHYELVRGADCVNVRTGDHIRFGSYEEYADFICTFEKKFKRIEKRRSKK